MSEPDEAELIRRAQLGDRLALGSLLEQHQPQLWRVTERMCRTRQDAEDVLQEALASAVRDLHGFRGEASLRTWLFSIARHACAKFYARTPAPAEAAVEDGSDEGGSGGASKSGPATPEAAASERELAAAVLRAIDELPQAQREALVLRDVEGLSAAEVAHVTQSSVEAVKSRLHRARRSVQRRSMEIAEPRLLEPVGAITPRTCPDILQLYSERLEGDLSQQLCELIQGHVDSCDSCRATCDGLKQTLAMCQAVPLGPVPDRIQRAVAQALHAGAAEPRAEAQAVRGRSGSFFCGANEPFWRRPPPDQRRLASSPPFPGHADDLPPTPRPRHVYLHLPAGRRGYAPGAAD